MSGIRIKNPLSFYRFERFYYKISPKSFKNNEGISYQLGIGQHYQLRQNSLIFFPTGLYYEKNGHHHQKYVMGMSNPTQSVRALYAQLMYTVCATNKFP